MNNKQPQSNWGDYYYQQQGPKGKAGWALELVHQINQAIPSFNEVFDEETFYVFAILVVVGAILLAIFLSKVVGITIREHDITITRDWGEPKPANPFQFPWKTKQE